MLFSMGVLLIFFSCFENPAAGENVYIAARQYSLPGVIWYDTQFKLATPKEYINLYAEMIEDKIFFTHTNDPNKSGELFITYTYDPHKGEVFIATCPSPKESERKTLKIIDYYPKKGYYKVGCKHAFEPASKSLDETCHKESEALLYGVGYNIPIPNNESSETKFFDVYKICSKDENTYFTIHDVDPKAITDLITEDSDDKSVYQFVPWLDMQTHALKITTQKEPKNSTNAPKHELNYLYLRNIDAAIRDYIKEHAYKTKIYSGLFETNEEKKTCKHIFKVLQFQTESNGEKAGKLLGFAVITRFDSPKNCPKVCKNIEIKSINLDIKVGILQSLWDTFHHKPFAYACKVDQNLITAFKLNNFIDKEMENPSSSQNDDIGVTSSADSGNNEGGADGGWDY